LTQAIESPPDLSYPQQQVATGTDHRGAGLEHVVVLHRSENLRTQAERIVSRARVPRLEKLFQNLRASCETDLVEKYPLHVACAWIGNTEDVASKHYLIIKDEHRKAASGQAAKMAKADAAKSAAPGAALSGALGRSAALTPSKNPRKIVIFGDLRRYLLPPRGVEQGAKGKGKLKKSDEGGAKSGADCAGDAAGSDRGKCRRGTNWKNLPPELRQLIWTLLRPYKR
jgi:hypothetical protein